MLASSTLWAASPLDLGRLRDVICAKESRTVETPERAVYQNEDTGKWDAGYCQISIDTLVDMGFLARPGKPATRDAQWIFKRDGSESIALEVLLDRYQFILSKGQQPTYGCIAVKFHWGKYAKCTREKLAHPYTREIVLTMQQVAGR